MDLALNNLQRLICHKTQPTNIFYVKKVYFLNKIKMITVILWFTCVYIISFLTVKIDSTINYNLNSSLYEYSQGSPQ